MQGKIPAVVLGNYYTALGVIRSLGRHGISVFWFPDYIDYVTHSRWCQPPRHGLKLPVGPTDLIPYLAGLSVPLAVLIPCSDIWARSVAELPPELSQKFCSSLPLSQSLDSLMDKAQLAALLKKSGIPHPTTVQLRNEEDLLLHAKEEMRDWFLKPADSQSFRKKFYRKAFRVSDSQDALQKYQMIAKEGFEVILQEYIPGPPTRHYFIDGFVDRHGELKALFARQRIRMYPLDFGDSSYLTTVPLSAVRGAEKSVKALLREVPYRGIFSVEFKHDDRDGEFKLIEVNTRPWVFVEFAAQCGVDVTYMSYLDALNQPVPVIVSYGVGESMTFLPNDIYAGAALIRQGRLGKANWLLSQVKALRTVIAWDDPLPDLARYKQAAPEVFRQLWQK